MKYSKEEIRKSMLLYAVTDRMWLKEGEKLTDVCKNVLEHGASFQMCIRDSPMAFQIFKSQTLPESHGIYQGSVHIKNRIWFIHGSPSLLPVFSDAL